MIKSNEINWSDTYLRCERRKSSYLKARTKYHRKQRLLQLNELKANSNITGIKAENHQYLKINMEV